MSKRPTTANVSGAFEPFHIDEVPWEEASRGSRFGLRFQHLSSFGGGSQISVSMEVLPPGKQANQSHITCRVSVKLTGESYHKSPTMEYWEGVDAERKP